MGPDLRRGERELGIVNIEGRSEEGRRSHPSRAYQADFTNVLVPEFPDHQSPLQLLHR